MAFFKEIETIKTSNALYQRWIDYVLSLEKSDILYIAENGLTHQAEAINSMIRELIADQPIDKKLISKLDLMIRTTNSYASKIR